MDTYEQCFDKLDDIDWVTEATPAAFNYEEELSYKLLPEMPNFDETMDVPSPISQIHSPPAMEPIKPIHSDDVEPYNKLSSTAAVGQRCLPKRMQTNRSPPALRDDASRNPPSPASDDKPFKKEPESPRKFKRPSSSLRPKYPRIVLKQNISPVRPPSTHLKLPTFAKKPKRETRPNSVKGWKPIQSFKPPER
ncbi:hypothetical protein AVEN_198790-1 [Araneus ventricosus]|uniref:Uncharacterized protein n=1 Tax=Araneus ventricosus TaxID=182803 RepID=A0A4Y2VZB0_ARAVE|nr:hypothetical protein AVEN_198790-1 [Araneus ventricosus]